MTPSRSLPRKRADADRRGLVLLLLTVLLPACGHAAPGPATTDADRNCVSNIHPHGLSPDTAAHRIAHLLSAMRTARHSGVALKDTSVDPAAQLGP